MNFVTDIMQEMIASATSFQSDVYPANRVQDDINHAMKVYLLARSIGQASSLSSQKQEILEAAALLHDIACPPLKRKFGRAEFDKQEMMGEKMAAEIVFKLHVPQPTAERIVHMVAVHHSPQKIDDADIRILMEADYIVNSLENGWYTRQKHLPAWFTTPKALELAQTLLQTSPLGESD